jgi:hypothetical protein
MPNAANRDYRDDKEERYKPHALLPDKISNSAALAATHLFAGFRSPRKEMRANNKEERDHHVTGFQ